MTIFRIVAAVAAGCFVAPAAAQDALPHNTIDCRVFVKEANGSWRPREVATFDLGNIKSLSVGPIQIGPEPFNVRGIDLYQVLEKKCGSK